MNQQVVVVLPGDKLDITVNEHTKLGVGLRLDGQSVFATVAGRLMTVPPQPPSHRPTTTYYILQSVVRYRPQPEDRIIGMVQDRAGSDGNGGDLYRVEMGASHPALLSNLSFEGATKRNKPNLAIGTLIYARVTDNNDSLLDCNLSCINGPHDGGVPRKDWMTNEGCYGELRGGMCTRISTGLARQLLHPDNTVLTALADHKLAFEVAVGVNGMLWMHSPLPEYTVLIQNAICNSQVLTEQQTRGMVKNLKYTVDKQLQQKMDAEEEG